LIDQVTVQSTELIVIDVEQAEPPRTLLEDHLYLFGRPKWSPTADVIAFMWSAGEGGEGDHLWLINADGSGQTQVTNNVRALSDFPLWSSDGEWIAMSGLAQFESESPHSDLWLVNPWSMEQKRVTYSPIDATTQFGVDSLMPMWTPDETQLVFFRLPVQGELAEVWLMSLVDGSERKLTEILRVFDADVIVSP
jgi:Tol biopolymer transport system component